MRIAVRYQSLGGSTRKVARAVAQALGVEAKPLDLSEELKDIDLLLVGGGLYAGKLHGSFAGFLGALTAEHVRNVACFFTSAKPDADMLPLAKEAMKNSAVRLLGDAFHCRGKFLFLWRKKPDEKDLARAGEFARKAKAVVEGNT